MAGPWERFAKQPGTSAQPAAPASSPKPWERYSGSKSAVDQQPALAVDAAPEQPGMLDRIGNLFTGADRETRATEDLPELQNSGLLAGLDIPVTQRAALATALATMTNPEEIAKTLQAASPDIGIQYDEKGNILAANSKTGARAVLNKPGFSGLDAAQLAATTAAFVPAGRVATAAGGGIARQAAVLGAGSAATQAAIEGTQAGAGGEFDTEDVAISGALGAAAPVIAGAVGTAVDAGRRGIQALRGQPAAQSELVQAAQQAKIPLMTSDVVQPDTFMGRSAQTIGERIPIAGTGPLRATQQEARQAAIRELGEQYPTPSANQIVSSLKAQTSKIKQAAAKRYQEIIPQVDQLGAVPYTKTSAAIDDALKELTRPGVVGSKEAFQELRQFQNTLGSADQTYSMLKENRTAFRDVVNAYDGMGRSQLPSRAKALLNRVYSALTEDMDEAAKAALSASDYKRLRDVNALYASEAEKLTKTRLKTVLDKGELTPEVAENLLFSTKRSEVKSLYDSLDSSGREAVRATIIQRAIDKSGGLDNISPEKFINEMRRYQTQTGIAFKGDERRQLEGLKQVLMATKRAGEAGAQTATGQQLYAPAGAILAGTLFTDLGTSLAAGFSVGTLARAYESAPIRNALIRIGSAPSSDASKRLALELARQLNAGAQSINAQSRQEPEMRQGS